MRTTLEAYLLCIFFGWAGAHRFYCGRIGTGVLWFLTGGLLGIGWLIDLFLVPSMVREANEEIMSFYRGRSQGPVHPPPPPRPGVAAYGQPVAKPMPPATGHDAASPGYRVVFCTQCGGPMQVPVHAVGSNYACPRCRTVLEIPAFA